MLCSSDLLFVLSLHEEGSSLKKRQLPSHTSMNGFWMHQLPASSAPSTCIRWPSRRDDAMGLPGSVRHGALVSGCSFLISLVHPVPRLQATTTNLIRRDMVNLYLSSDMLCPPLPNLCLPELHASNVRVDVDC